MQLGIGLGINRLQGGGFSPATLFSAGEVGTWYDPSDLTTLFQDSAGTTPVTAAGQSVGLVLDKSKGLALGAELVSNGTFDSNTTGWARGFGSVDGTFVASGGLGVYTVGAGDGVAPRMVFTLSGLTSGASYRVSFTEGTASGAGDRLVVWTSTANGTGGTNLAQTTAASWNGESLSYIVTATATTMYLAFAFNGTSAGATGSIDNVSVRLLPGNHASQSTLASRPIYGTVPATGRRNLLTYSEQFDNAAWLALAGGTGVAPTVTANAGTSPIGDNTADRIQFNRGAGTTNADISRIFQSAALLPSGVGIQSVWMRSFDGVSSFSLTLTNGSASSTVTVTGSWQRFSLVSISTTINFQIRTQGDTTQQTADVLVWGAQLETGSTATAYQRVGSAFDITEAGVQTLHYLSFDGSDDWLVTGTITPGADKAQVFAGVRKNNDTAAILVEHSATVATNNGTLYIVTGQDPTAAQRYSSIGRGDAAATAGQAALMNTGNAPESAVITATHDIAGDLSAIRRNGVAGTNGTSDKGAGNFLAYPLYIGRRGGTTLPFNGNLYGLVVRFSSANLAADSISATERWMAGKTGVTI